MSGCTGRCNQGRACTCFDPSAGEAVPYGLLATLAVVTIAVAVAFGFLSATLMAAQSCEAGGTFSAWGAVYECSVKALT